MMDSGVSTEQLWHIKKQKCFSLFPLSPGGRPGNSRDLGGEREKLRGHYYKLGDRCPMNDSEAFFLYMKPDENNDSITTIFPVPE